MQQVIRHTLQLTGNFLPTTWPTYNNPVLRGGLILGGIFEVKGCV